MLAAEQIYSKPQHQKGGFFFGEYQLKRGKLVEQCFYMVNPIVMFVKG